MIAEFWRSFVRWLRRLFNWWPVKPPDEAVSGKMTFTKVDNTDKEK